MYLDETLLAFSYTEMLKISATFCLFWFAANYFYNLSLNLTNISSNTILANTSILFVFLFSICFLKTEKYNWLKIVLVFVSFSGAVVVILSDPSDSKEDVEWNWAHISGDVFALFSAMSYGIYATFLKKWIPESREKYFKTSLFLGLLGLCNIVLLLPLFPILNYTGIEPFEFPHWRTLAYLTLNAIIGTCISNFCWAKSVLILGPLITQLGITLTIPLGMLATSLISKVHFSFLYFFGAFLVFASFFGIIMNEKRIAKND
jgi:solute carrier family 35, member F5